MSGFLSAWALYFGTLSPGVSETANLCLCFIYTFRLNFLAHCLWRINPFFLPFYQHFYSVEFSHLTKGHFSSLSHSTSVEMTCVQIAVSHKSD